MSACRLPVIACLAGLLAGLQGCSQPRPSGQGAQPPRIAAAELDRLRAASANDPAELGRLRAAIPLTVAEALRQDREAPHSAQEDPARRAAWDARYRALEGERIVPPAGDALLFGQDRRQPGLPPAVRGVIDRPVPLPDGTTPPPPGPVLDLWDVRIE